MPKAGQRPLGLLRIILCKARPRSMTMPRWTGMGTFGLADLIDSQAPKSSQEFPRVPKSSQEFRYKFALNVHGALGARDAHVSIHFSLGAITSAKKRLKCNSMASVFHHFLMFCQLKDSPVFQEPHIHQAGRKSPGSCLRLQTHM